MTDCTWPEQDALEEWLKRVDYEVTDRTSWLHLKKAVTAYRIEVQEKLAMAEEKLDDFYLVSKDEFDKVIAYVEDAEKMGEPVPVSSNELKALKSDAPGPTSGLTELESLVESIEGSVTILGISNPTKEQHQKYIEKFKDDPNFSIGNYNGDRYIYLTNAVMPSTFDIPEKFVERQNIMKKHLGECYHCSLNKSMDSEELMKKLPELWEDLPVKYKRLSRELDFYYDAKQLLAVDIGFTGLPTLKYIDGVWVYADVWNRKDK